MSFMFGAPRPCRGALDSNACPPEGGRYILSWRNAVKAHFISQAGICAGLAIALGIFCPPPSKAQGNVPRYEVDPTWPKPLPNRWVTGEMGGVCVDSQDHIFIAQRVNDVGGMDGHLEGDRKSVV